VGVLTGAVYEWKAHSVLFLKAAIGVDEGKEKLAKLLESGREGEAWQWNGFSDLEKSVLQYTKESTLAVTVCEEVFARTRELLGDDQKIMELQITVGAYNMVSRFLVGLDVTESNGGDMVVPEN
jgi:alkylhydroperoxidase family enzyme